MQQQRHRDIFCQYFQHNIVDQFETVLSSEESTTFKRTTDGTIVIIYEDPNILDIHKISVITPDRYRYILVSRHMGWIVIKNIMDPSQCCDVPKI